MILIAPNFYSFFFFFFFFGRFEQDFKRNHISLANTKLRGLQGGKNRKHEKLFVPILDFPELPSSYSLARETTSVTCHKKCQ